MEVRVCLKDEIPGYDYDLGHGSHIFDDHDLENHVCREPRSSMMTDFEDFEARVFQIHNPTKRVEANGTT